MTLADAETLKMWVADTGADIIVAVGGDGTIRRVLEAMDQAQVDLPVGIIPMGTGNLLAKSLALICPHKDRVESALQAIFDGHTERLDLGRANGRIFAISVGVGPLANAVVAPTPRQKSIWKMFAYLPPYLKCLAKRPVTLDLEIDGEKRRVKASGLFITNEKGMGLTTEPGNLETLRDAKLHLYLFKPVQLTDWIRLGWGMAVAYFTHRLIDNAPYTEINAKRISVTSKKSTGYMLDGDRCTMLPLTVESVPRAVQIFVPRMSF